MPAPLLIAGIVVAIIIAIVIVGLTSAIVVAIKGEKLTTISGTSTNMPLRFRGCSQDDVGTLRCVRA